MLEYVPLIPIQKRINMLLAYTRNLNALMLSNASKVIKIYHLSAEIMPISIFNSFYHHDLRNTSQGWLIHVNKNYTRIFE